MIEFLSEIVPEFPIVDTVTQDVSVNISLPAFPYDKISIDEKGQVVYENKDDVQTE